MVHTPHFLIPLRRSKHYRSESGLGSLTLLVFSVIIGVVVWVGYNVIPFYYYYYDLKNQFEQMIKVASVETDHEIRKRLLTFIHRYHIPCDDEDLRIERSANTMRIILRYQEVFYVTWGEKDYDLYRFDFDATTEGQFK